MDLHDPPSAIPHPQALLLMGRVGKAHGLRGEVKVIPETDDPQRFEALDVVFLGARPEAVRPWTVESVRYQRGKRGVTVVLKLADVDTRPDAEALHGKEVFAREDDLPPLGEGEFFIHDLIGLEVVTNRGEPVGAVKEVMELPAYLVYVVARPGKPEALIPAVPAFVREVDLEGARLVVQPIEGLLD